MVNGKSEKKENELISKQRNELVNLSWHGLDALDINFFWVICRKFNKTNSEEIILDVNEIKLLAAYHEKESRTAFMNRIVELGRKINQSFNYEFLDIKQRTYGIYNLFPSFCFTESTDKIRVRVNPDFAYLLNDFSERYTQIDLLEMTEIKNAYAKRLYIHLRQYMPTGYWQVSKDEIKEYLCMPPKSQASRVTEILQQAVKELEKFIPGLKLKAITKKSGSSKGRKSIIAYQFVFDRQEKRKSYDRLTQEQIADMTGATWTGKYCPECGEKIFSKNFTTEDGTVFPQLGHTDYKTGKCKFRPLIYELLTNEEADAKFGGKKREATKGPSEEAKAKQEQREAEIFAAEDREREAEEKALSEQQERELTEKLGRKPTEEELTEDSKRRALEALKIYKY